jgi:hypothetical protein
VALLNNDQQFSVAMEDLIEEILISSGINTVFARRGQ